MCKIKDNFLQLREDENLNKYSLYVRETQIVSKINSMTSDIIFINNKEKIKKKTELFHLMVLVDGYDFDIQTKCIILHEPGDFFIISVDNKKYLIEVVTIFGNEKEYRLINENIQKLLTGQNINSFWDTYDSSKSFTLLKNKLADKNMMRFNDDSIDGTILLVVTTESDRCAVACPWILSEFDEELEQSINNDNFNKIIVLDYYSSGLDGAETVFDLRKKLIEYKKYLIKK